MSCKSNGIVKITNHLFFAKLTDSNWKKKGNKNSNNKNYNVLKRLGICVTSYFSAAEHKRVDMITKIFQPTGYDEF